MGSPVARLGDVSDHGGHITTASSNVKANGVGVARAGDSHSCPVIGHGVTALSSGSTVKANGLSVVRVGDRAACGAMITGGSATVRAG
jgi:uncharacterized Zn-binding protein involved in type VI secretion